MGENICKAYILFKARLGYIARPSLKQDICFANIFSHSGSCISHSVGCFLCCAAFVNKVLLKHTGVYECLWLLLTFLS
jgi:hypothetical protein